ncbi:sigma-70 family RNA polymerase sigma factor [Micromonospora sp. CPCC 205539]|uniref:sigma-70 family RNA polymerase sigma factor n=1 Tax=Micromonospora sp. CPCC 205539 TaxID=3122408 RepID=UPI002FF248A8
MNDFEAHRGHLRSVAYRILGSASEADDAVQEAWLRSARADHVGIRNTRAWLTTVVARVCLDMLRARTARREVVLDAALPSVSPDPEQQALLADSVGLALLVVLDTLPPAERLSFVLHDMFAVPFEEIGSILGRSTPAAKMLASRARRRLRDAEAPDVDVTRQRKVVDAFLAASREGDFAALLDLLAPDVIARADGLATPGGVPTRLRGANAVARQALAFSQRARHASVGLVDGAVAILVAPQGRLAIVLTFAIHDSRIAAVDIIADPQRLAALSITPLEDEGSG